MVVKYIRLWKAYGYNFYIHTSDFSLDLLRLITKDFHFHCNLEKMTGVLDIHLTHERKKHARPKKGGPKQVA